MVALMQHDEEQEAPQAPEEVQRLWMLPTYSEARTWFQWLNVFVPSDVADSMGVTLEVAERFCKAGVWHGIIINTEDYDGREYIYEYVPLPPGPREHPTKEPPERLVGYVEILSPRGLPVRIRTERDMRRTMSTPGARGNIARNEARYRAMQDAVAKRRAVQLAKASEEPKWRKVKKKSTPTKSVG